MWLDADTVLVGRVDAQGLADGEPFFGEWKTTSGWNKNKMGDVKQTWRLDPQALTYGVLIPEAKKFTVRWAIKSNPPMADFEWYTYTADEVEWWRRQLLQYAYNIREYRQHVAPWQPNLTNCFKYGVKYRCPFFDEGCSQLQFGARPSHMSARTPHLTIERDIVSITTSPNLVVLDASRVETFMTCAERYRRTYEGAGASEESEAMTIGTDFHSLYAAHLRGIMEKQHDARTD